MILTFELVRTFDDVDAKNGIVERKVFGRDRRLGQQPVRLSSCWEAGQAALSAVL